MTYIANSNISLYHLAEMTGQHKENIPFYIKSEYNLADLLIKFDMTIDSVDTWFNLQKTILDPPLLQSHPKTYL